MAGIRCKERRNDGSKKVLCFSGYGRRLKMKKKYLFLDDLRSPVNEPGYPGYKPNDGTWTVVRDYDSFVNHILQNGLPDFVTFDFDLSMDDYPPESMWDDDAAQKEWCAKHVFTRRTGLDCARWLVEYCKRERKQLPDWACHSINPAGKEWIEQLLTESERILAENLSGKPVHNSSFNYCNSMKGETNND
jgi:hypothetical protein